MMPRRGNAPHLNPNAVYRDVAMAACVFLGAFDGTNAGSNQTINDSSTNNWTVTRSGTPNMGTISPMSPQHWSVEFVSSSSTYLHVPASSDFNFGTADFTCEGFLYFNGALAACDLIGNMTGTTAADWSVGITAAGALQFQLATVISTSATGLITRNAWHHWAIARTNGVIRLFVDGVMVLNVGASAAAIGDATRVVNIGSRQITGSTNYFSGFMHGVRVLNGMGFYDQTFKPTTVVLTNKHPNCVLLTCQSNRFVDISTTPVVVTAVGGPVIRPNSPLAPLAPYSAAAHAGSIRLGSTTDYMTIANNTAFRFTANQDFTIEGWFFPTAINTEMVMVSKANNMGTLVSNSWLFTLASGVPTFTLSTSGSAAAYTVTGPAVTLNAWNHVVIVRIAGVNTVYTNGVAGTPVTNTGASYTGETEVLGVGYRRNNGGTVPVFTGFVSQVRIVKGTGVYTGAFTPPTTPLTAITNTILLLNFTSAQIIDLSGTSNIGVVGTAPTTSTTRFKYGTASLLMAGTGSCLGANNDIFGFGTGDFTIEGDFYLATNTIQTLVSFWTTTASVSPCIKVVTGMVLGYCTANVTRITSGTTLATGAWHNFAVSRINGVTRLFLDGTLQGTPYTDTNDYGVGNPIGLGDFNSGSSRLNGNLDNVRVLKGVGLYAASYTLLGKAFALQ
jgi:hypothetical protein